MMEQWDFSKPEPRIKPYDSGLRLVVPLNLLRETHRFFAPYHLAQVETACFWFGIQVESTQIGLTLALPQLRQSRGHYQVVPGSLRRLAAAMRVQALTNLAQVHTHPASWVGHSRYDDNNAYSTREGALSLVWPNYGEALHRDLGELGIHERQNGCWVRLDPTLAAQRIRIVDDLADYRWQLTPGDRDDEG